MVDITPLQPVPAYYEVMENTSRHYHSLNTVMSEIDGRVKETLNLLRNEKRKQTLNKLL